MIDVAVIGGGIAGFAAALSARLRGATVTVVLGQPGSTALAGSAWDVVPLSGQHDSIEEAFVTFRTAHLHHPYARLGDFDELKSCHEMVLQALDLYAPLKWSSRGVQLVTDLGRVRWAATAHRTTLDLNRVQRGLIAVVSADDVDGPSAYALADSVRACTSGYELVAVQLSSFPNLCGPDGGDTEGARAALNDALQRAAAGRTYTGVLMPSAGNGVQGIERSVTTRDALVGEIATCLASAPSARWMKRMRAALQKHDCTLLESDARSVTPISNEVRVQLGSEEALRAKTVILATGKHVGGGIRVAAGVLVEPVCNLPMFLRGEVQSTASSLRGPDPTHYFGSALLAGGDGYFAGVGYDRSLRALNKNALPVSSRLFVAGALLEGCNPALDGTGLGCSAFTGFLAGRHAAQVALDEKR